MNTKYRQDASIAAMAGILSSLAPDQKITPEQLSCEAHDYAEAMLAEEIKRHGEEAELQKQYDEDLLKLKAAMDKDWITWNGGECPVSPDTVVEVELRNGVFRKRVAKSFHWHHAKKGDDVIRYRVVEG